MAYKSEVKVQYERGGSPGSNKRVVLSFGCGQTKPVFTNSRGVAIVDHVSRGEVTIYVAGRVISVLFSR